MTGIYGLVASGVWLAVVLGAVLMVILAAYEVSELARRDLQRRLQRESERSQPQHRSTVAPSPPRTVPAAAPPSTLADILPALQGISENDAELLDAESQITRDLFAGKVGGTDYQRRMRDLAEPRRTSKSPRRTG
ncbi:hypothetical protein IU459_15830 [Nocardia amamiensis]|uniref:SHOCT domain-containing protein n=1 Tax=Nocardia amamiensis TaxID=404578 RepID=A0ABS0CQX3_9NOCA|nr:hypothetical protein [Nocardia amamiensis]MBF6299002.1 hypothetical protein [Nocardia amamiensis]